MQMEILELPRKRPAAPVKRFDFQGLSDILFESADLLEEAKESQDAEFRAAALDLAIRSLYTASAAIDRHLGGESRKASAEVPATTAATAILSGPWAGE